MKLDKTIKEVLNTLDILTKDMHPEYLIYEDSIANRGKNSNLAIEINMVNIKDTIYEVLFINDDVYLIDVYDAENMLEDKFLRAEKMEAESGSVVKKQVNINEYLLSKINKIRNE
jgi:hypothetical protein